MPTEEREPFEIRSAKWYDKPLDYQVIIYEVNYDSHVATVTMNRPDKRNGLSHQLRAELIHAPKVAEGEDNINVVDIVGCPCVN